MDSVNDNFRHRLVEAARLSGPAFQRLQIVFAGEANVAKVKKDFAYKDAEPTPSYDVPSLGAQEVGRQPELPLPCDKSLPMRHDGEQPQVCQAALIA